MKQITKKTATKLKVEASVDLRELLIMKVRVLYGIELELLKALPVMAKKANDADLKSLFEEHAEKTEDHVKRLLSACELLGVKAQKTASESIRGLIADVDWIVKNIKGVAALDASLLAAACVIECHEIAQYETAIAWAKLLDNDEVSDLLEETLDEEDDVFEELNDLAELKIDEKALPEGFATGEADEADDEEEDADEADEEGEG